MNFLFSAFGAAAITFIIINVGKKRKRITLGAKYYFNNLNVNSKMATYTLTGDQSKVQGTLIPLQNGNPVDLSNLRPDSDSYFSSDRNIADVSKDGFGNFTVKRVADEGGTVEIKYAAFNLNDAPVGGGDTFVFEAKVKPIVVDGLTASYGTPE